MPKKIPFSGNDIKEMRRMREAGAPLREIAARYQTSATTILSYVRDIKPDQYGQNVEWTPADAIYDWMPALPHEGLPLPRWIATWLRELAESQQLDPRNQKDEK